MLRAAVALQCLGAAGGISAKGTPIASFLFLEARVSESATKLLDTGLVAALIGLAALVLVKPVRAGLFALAGLFGLLSLASAYMGGYFAAQIAPVAQAVRYTGPLALVALAAGAPRRAERLLVWGAAAVFFAHGVEAVLLNPKFVDYLILTVDRLLQIRMTQHTAEGWLYAIGAADLALAVMVVAGRSKWVWGYMAFWGLATAGMRMVYYGPALGYHHTLIRALNGAAPLVLLIASQLDMFPAAAWLGVRRRKRSVWVEQA